jgi:OCT family organic cation transporter-like MFS transporter 4/5
LPEDRYLSGYIQNSIDIIAYIVSGLLAQFIGRKIVLKIAFIMIALTNIFIFTGIITGVLDHICIYLIRFLAVNAYNVVFVYTLELYPTVVRSYGYGINIFCSQIGNVFVPICNEFLGKTNQLVYSLINAICFVFVFFLSETQGKPMTDHIPECMHGISPKENKI